MLSLTTHLFSDCGFPKPDENSLGTTVSLIIASSITMSMIADAEFTSENH